LNGTIRCRPANDFLDSLARGGFSIKFEKSKKRSWGSEERKFRVQAHIPGGKRIWELLQKFRNSVEKRRYHMVPRGPPEEGDAVFFGSARRGGVEATNPR